MVTRTGSGEEEPTQSSFQLPSEGVNHLFQITEVYDFENQHPKISLGENNTVVKLEVVGGDEEGRTMLHWVNLDDQWTGFFSTRLFLKAIGEPYKGKDFPMNTENWQTRRFLSTVTHSVSEKNGKTYCNIGEYDIEESLKIKQLGGEVVNPEDISWDN